MIGSSLNRDQVSFQDTAVIIGLEVHVQLLTKTKLFCGCTTTFGAPANQQTCPICTGMPGTLPVLNQAAIDLAIRAGLALNCQIAQRTKWDRKNYFYPDLPKGYQTSQFDLPICGAGQLEFVSPVDGETIRNVRIERAHLEEDAGKSLHDESKQGNPSKIDLNRSGTPLLEIVTKPDLRSAVDAKAFLQELKLLLTYIKASDCNMEQGSLRCDANVNLHIGCNGDSESLIATPIVEIKNLNSFRAVERAIDYEARRQFEAWQRDGKTIGQAPKQTRGWNDSVTYIQRDKEDFADYRYFPCPDLISYQVSPQQIEAAKSETQFLPSQLRDRLESEYQLKKYDANVIVSQGRGVVDFFLDVARQIDNKKLVANWVIQEVLRYLNEHNVAIENYPLSPVGFAELLLQIESGKIDQTRAKDILNTMVEQKIDLNSAITELGIVSVNEHEIQQLARQLLDENPTIIQQVQDGNLKAIGALIGKAKKINPNANPAAVKEEILRTILKRGQTL